MNGRHGGFGAIPKLDHEVKVLTQHLCPPLCGGDALLGQFLQIKAGTEGAAFASQDDGPNGVIGDKCFERLCHFGHQLTIDGVELFGAIETNHADTADRFKLNAFERSDGHSDSDLGMTSRSTATMRAPSTSKGLISISCTCVPKAMPMAINLWTTCTSWLKSVAARPRAPLSKG